jgi:hypothetical protein
MARRSAWCIGLLHGLQDGCFTAKPVRPVGMPGLVVFAGGTVAVGDLGLEELTDLRVGQVAALDLAGAQATCRAGDMGAAVSPDGDRIDGFGVADRAQR